jgi:CheY-like chemotaxis protein
MSKAEVNKENVDYCFDGEDAIQNVKHAYENGMKYSIILLDFNMPRIGGLEAAVAIKEYLLKEQNIPEQDLPALIGLTANDISFASFNGLANGMDNIYQKPLGYDELEKLL